MKSEKFWLIILTVFWDCDINIIFGTYIFCFFGLLWQIATTAEQGKTYHNLNYHEVQKHLHFMPNVQVEMIDNFPLQRSVIQDPTQKCQLGFPHTSPSRSTA